MARIYATKTQLEDYLGAGATVPADAGRLLRSASRDVDEMLLTAVYPVSEDGLPTVPADEEAIREATCLQAMHRDKHGDEVEMPAPASPSGLAPSASVARSRPARTRLSRSRSGIPKRTECCACTVSSRAV